MQRRKQNAAISLAVIDAHCHAMGTPVLALEVNNPPANAGSIRDAVSIPGSRRSPGVGNSNPLQYSCLENYMGRGAWWATIHMVAKGRTRLKPLSMHWWLSGKESACDAGDEGSIPGSGRSPGEENGYPLQYSCLGNPMDRGAWQAIVHGVTKQSDMT